MLEQYTWGDFTLFVFVLVVLYYLVVGFLYYRQELTALLNRKGGGGARLAGTGPGGASSTGPPSLVRTASAFVAATPEATESREEPKAADAGASQNLPQAREVAEVTGSLPDSSAAAKGSDDGDQAAAPMDSASAVSKSDAAADYDEHRTEELDEVDTTLAARARQLAAQMPTDGPEAETAVEASVATPAATTPAPALIATPAEPLEQAAGDAMPAREVEPADSMLSPVESFIEKSNTKGDGIETISIFAGVEAGMDDEPDSVDVADLLYSFDTPIASPADVVGAPAEQLFAVTSVVDFIAQAQSGNRPAVPAAIQATSLASLVADRVAESNEELNSLFGDDED